MLYCKVLFLLLLCRLCFTARSKVLLISFDGFRWDYLDIYRGNTSWFHYLIDDGVTSEDGSMIGTYITNTFPSHTTLSTGLFEESHGITGNTMYDPKTGANFSLGNRTAQRDPFWWKNAVPLWITAEENGVRSGTYFWPGSEASYEGRFQTIGMPYTGSLPFERRVDDVSQWFSSGVIDFATLYFNEPDSAGHKAGPYSKKGGNPPKSLRPVTGAHGYDNNVTSMRPIFLAHGPSFKAGTRVKPFRQVDIYNMVTRILKIPGRPNNGSWDRVKDLLSKADKVRGIKGFTLIAIFVLIFHLS